MKTKSNALNDSEKGKIHAAQLVAKNFVFDSFTVGVGTGSTVNYFIQMLSELVEEEELEIITVPSSIETEIQLTRSGLSTGTLIEYPELDLYVDGADIITKDFVLIKGGGAALTIEKIMASSSQEFIVIADQSKYPAELLSHPVPIEILPKAINTVVRPIFTLGGEFQLRYGKGKMGPIITDNGNIIGDVYFKQPYNPSEIEKSLNCIPGVIENGIFCSIVHKIVIGNAETANAIIVNNTFTEQL